MSRSVIFAFKTLASLSRRSTFSRSLVPLKSSRPHLSIGHRYFSSETTEEATEEPSSATNSFFPDIEAFKLAQQPFKDKIRESENAEEIIATLDAAHEAHVSGGLLSNRAIKRLLDLRLPEDALKVFQKMPEHGLRPDIWTFECFVLDFARRNDVANATQAINEMTDQWQIPMSHMMAATYLKLLLQNKLWEKGWDFYHNHMPVNAQGLKAADVGAYHMLFRACQELPAEKGKEMCTHLWDECNKKQIKKSALARDSVIATLANFGFVENAQDLFSVMESRGMMPSKFTFHALIRAQCKAHNMRGALQTFSSMKASNHQISVEIYDMLIRAFAETQQYSHALRVFEKFLGENRREDENMSQVILLCYVKSRQISGLVEYLKKSPTNLVRSRMNTVFEFIVQQDDESMIKDLVFTFSEMARQSGLPFDSQAIGAILVQLLKRDLVAIGVDFLQKWKELITAQFVFDPIFLHLLSTPQFPASSDTFRKLAQMMKDLDVPKTRTTEHYFEKAKNLSWIKKSL